MAYFEGTRQHIDDAKTPTAAVSVLIKSLILRLGESLAGEDTENQVRVLRDKLEQEKDGLIASIAKATGDDRGPDAPDSSDTNPAEDDPLREDQPAAKGEQVGKRNK